MKRPAKLGWSTLICTHFGTPSSLYTRGADERALHLREWEEILEMLRKEFAMNEIREGIHRHFKGNLYRVLCVRSIRRHWKRWSCIRMPSTRRSSGRGPLPCGTGKWTPAGKSCRVFNSSRPAWVSWTKSRYFGSSRRSRTIWSSISTLANTPALLSQADGRHPGSRRRAFGPGGRRRGHGRLCAKSCGKRREGAGTSGGSTCDCRMTT